MQTVKNLVATLLVEARGFLQLADLKKIASASRPVTNITIGQLSEIAESVNVMKAAGVPALFEPALYQNARSFPVMEFVIHFGADTYLSHVYEYVGGMLRAGRANKGDVYKEFRLPNVGVEDLRKFRSRVFDGNGIIEPAFRREIAYYVATHFDADEVGMSRDSIALDLLEKRLAGMNVPNRSVYDEVPAEGLAEIISRWGWYLDYTPECRSEIVKAWAASLPQNEFLVQEKEISRRLSQIFPEDAEFLRMTRENARREHLISRIEVGVALAEVVGDRDFRKIPHDAFSDAVLWEKFGSRIVTAFREACRDFARRDPEAVFGNSWNFGRVLRLPREGLSCRSEFKGELDMVRLETAVGLRDEVFLRLFGGTHGSAGHARRTTIGHVRKGGVESESSRALRWYVIRRWERQRG
jgi:hypothetical protein